MCDAAVWAPQVAALGARYRCVVADYGALASLGAMAEGALAQAPGGQLAIAGHSMGGRVAFEIMRRAPERVSQLALLDTACPPLAEGAEGERERTQRYALLRKARDEGMRAMARQWASGMVHPQRLDTPLFEAILDMIERSSPEIFAAQIEALLARPDATPLLGEICCPTLVLAGREDAWNPPPRHIFMHERIADSRLVFIEDSGHMCTMEQPDRVSAELAVWLEMPPSTGRA